MLKEIAVIILVSAVASGLVVAGCALNLSPVESTEVGNQAPDFQLTDLDGNAVSLSDLRGKPVLINFWASWRRPCRTEMPYLQQVYEEWSDRGLVVLAINRGETPSEIRQFMRNYELTLPVLVDMKEAITEMYDVWSIPTTFFIDKNGVIQAKVVGAFSSKEAIEAKLAEIVP